jgi:hypothetical protein
LRTVTAAPLAAGVAVAEGELPDRTWKRIATTMTTATTMMRSASRKRVRKRVFTVPPPCRGVFNYCPASIV